MITLSHVATLIANWPRSLDEAVAVQNELRHQVRLEYDGPGDPDVIAGVDVSYDLKTDTAKAVIQPLDFNSLKPHAPVIGFAKVPFPYVPGFLSFREVPAILNALLKLDKWPAMLMVDGQGIAHPRRFGIACHIGVLTGLPSIGVAKSRLTGWFKEPAMIKGAQAPLLWKGELLGTVLRSKDKVKPLFISPGHRIDHATAVRIVQDCLTRYRLPEPTRLADKVSKEWTAEQRGAGLLL